MNTIPAFCAACRQESAHVATLDKVGDAVLTCPTDGCGHALKVPAAALVDRTTLDTYLSEHKAALADQVLATVAEAEEAARTAGFNALFGAARIVDA